MSDLSLLVTDDYSESVSLLTDKNDKLEEEKVKSEKKVKVIKVLFFVLCSILLVELISYKYVMPCFSAPKITISGQKDISEEKLEELLQPVENASWLNFDVNYAVSILSSQAAIDSVVVEKKFPDKIYINIKERIPVAVTFVEENGVTYPVKIDKNGFMFPEYENEVVDTSSVPIISGLPVEYMSNGMRIPSKYKTLMEEIYKINQLPQKYFASISEICVLPKDYGSYELALIPSQSKVKVLTDRSLNEDALKYMMIVLDVVNQLGCEVSEVDLRYGSVSYKTK